LADNNIYIEKELLLRVAKGDGQAFNQIYELYSGTIYNTLVRFTQDPEEAKELSQQIFIKLWESRAVLEQVASLKDYLFIATRNAVFNYFKQLSRQARLKNQLDRPYETANPPIQIAAEQREFENLWQRAINRLPLQQKQVYQRIERENGTLDQVAEELQISRATAKKHLELARKSVRNHLRKALPSYFGEAPSTAIIIFLIFFQNHYA
jgi:RNA polymerase sigma-70 factor (ECF subfamily)